MNYSMTRVRAALRASTFDPRKPGHMTTIVTETSPSYVVMRVQEMLRNYEAHSTEAKLAKLRDAISLLAYAEVSLEAESGSARKT